MKKETLKNLTDSHGWIGVIISGLLFLIFFAGSISLFRDEIFQWSVTPTHEQTLSSKEILSPTQIIKLATRDEHFDAKQILTVIPPSHESPYYKVFFRLLEPRNGRDFVNLLMAPNTGEIVGEQSQFHLARFIYALHESAALPSPYGRYIIGIITLFFFFITISGVFLHAKKLFKNFFQYRADSNKRSRWLDMHNVIGTISLPFTVMYAITGLVFNLIIIYQIIFAVVLYKGDQAALIKDVGIQQVAPEWSDTPQKFDNIDRLIAEHSAKLGHPPTNIRIYNYNDKSAVMVLNGKGDNDFPFRYQIGLNLNDETVLFKSDNDNYNEVIYGTNVLTELHFGSFAGLDLRVIYFLLGLAVCALIVTGNLLWIEKRQKKRNTSQRSVVVMTTLTLASTIGVVIACSVAFLAERLLPVSWSERPQLMIYAFLIALFASSIATIFLKKHTLLVGGLFLSGAILVITVSCDWLMFGNNLIALWSVKDMTVFSVQLGILLVALLFAICAYSIHRKRPFKQVNPV